jgi:hypothetical protein
MWMSAESGAGSDSILVDHAQRSEFDMPGIEIVCKRKAVIRIEPPVLGVAAFAAASDGIYVDLLLQVL